MSPSLAASILPIYNVLMFDKYQKFFILQRNCGLIPYYQSTNKFDRLCDALFDRNTFGQVSGLVNIRALDNSHVIG